MGAGKTYLMAAFIYLDLYFAKNVPTNPAFAHNFIIFAPSGLKSSVVPSLKTIQDFNPHVGYSRAYSYRCLPSETIAQVYEELQELIDQLHREDPRFEAEIRDVFGGTTLPHIPFCTDPDSGVVKAAEKALRASGMEPVLSCCPAWTDAGFLQAGTDSQCIILGPGDIATAHSVHERISKKQILMATEIYKSMAMEISRVIR